MNIKQGVNQLVFWCLCLYKVNLSDFFFYYFIFSYIREILFKDTTIHSYYYYWRNVTLKIFSTYLWNAKERSSYQNIYILFIYRNFVELNHIITLTLIFTLPLITDKCAYLSYIFNHIVVNYLSIYRAGKLLFIF